MYNKQFLFQELNPNVIRIANNISVHRDKLYPHLFPDGDRVRLPYKQRDLRHLRLPKYFENLFATAAINKKTNEIIPYQ